MRAWQNYSRVRTEKYNVGAIGLSGFSHLLLKASTKTLVFYCTRLTVRITCLQQFSARLSDCYTSKLKLG